MFEPREHEGLFLHALRLAARAASIVCLAIIILFFVGEGINFSQVAFKEWIGLLLFPGGVFVGLVLAWREEGLGGAIVVVSILAFYLIYGWLLSGTIRQGWAFLPFLVPGILFLLYRIFSTPHLSPKQEKLGH
jgi:hypothetical protein